MLIVLRHVSLFLEFQSLVQRVKNWGKEKMATKMKGVPKDIFLKGGRRLSLRGDLGPQEPCSIMSHVKYTKSGSTPEKNQQILFLPCPCKCVVCCKF